jgi:hypothetical protein
MSNKKDKRPDRRSLLATAAAAGAALPLLASAAKAQSNMMGPSQSGTKIVVDLGTVRLPDATAAALETEVRAAVLRACASASVKVPPLTVLHPGIRGIVFQPM